MFQTFLVSVLHNTENFILIIQKLVIKDFVCSEERKIKIAEHLINKTNKVDANPRI